MPTTVPTHILCAMYQKDGLGVVTGQRRLAVPFTSTIFGTPKDAGTHVTATVMLREGMKLIYPVVRGFTSNPDEIMAWITDGELPEDEK
jgi:hypothetical protein